MSVKTDMFYPTYFYKHFLMENINFKFKFIITSNDNREKKNHVTFSLITLDYTTNTGNCTVLHVDLHTDNTFLGLLIMNTFWLHSLFLLRSLPRNWRNKLFVGPFNSTFTITVLATVIYNISRTSYILYNKNSITVNV
jgi:hypothetical protein